MKTDSALSRRVKPGVSRRSDFTLLGDRSALLIIDIQKYLSIPRSAAEANQKLYFFNNACPAAIKHIAKLTEAFRLVRDKSSRGCEVVFTYLQSSTQDGRDISLDYKLSGPDLTNIPRVGIDSDEIFLDELKPDITTGKGDILIPKTSCDVFASTNIDYVLRNLNIEQLVIVGQLTDECVQSAVRSAADRGYFVTLVEDACASFTREKHAKGLEGVKGFARIISTEKVLEELVDALAAEMGHSSEHSKTSPETEINEEAVVTFLQNRGMHKVAKQIEVMFTIKNISKKKEVDKKDEHKEPRSPRRKPARRTVSPPPRGKGTQRSDGSKTGDDEISHQNSDHTSFSKVSISPSPNERPKATKEVETSPLASPEAEDTKQNLLKSPRANTKLPPPPLSPSKSQSSGKVGSPNPISPKQETPRSPKKKNNVVDSV